MCQQQKTGCCNRTVCSVIGVVIFVVTAVAGVVLLLAGADKTNTANAMGPTDFAVVPAGCQIDRVTFTSRTDTRQEKSKEIRTCTDSFLWYFTKGTSGATYESKVIESERCDHCTCGDGSPHANQLTKFLSHKNITCWELTEGRHGLPVGYSLGNKPCA